MNYSDYLHNIVSKLRTASKNIEFLHIEALNDQPFAYYLKWLLQAQTIFGITEDRPAGTQKHYPIDRVIRFLFRKESQKGITIRKTYGPIEKPHPKFRNRQFSFWLFRIKMHGFKEFRLVVLTGWYRPGFHHRAIYISNDSRTAAHKLFEIIK